MQLIFAINNLHLQIITSYWSKFFHQQRFEHIVISISKCSQSESIIISDDGNNHFKTREACNDNLTDFIYQNARKCNGMFGMILFYEALNISSR